MATIKKAKNGLKEPNNPGLKQLPTPVRNKMGFKKNGGNTKAKMGASIKKAKNGKPIKKAFLGSLLGGGVGKSLLEGAGKNLLGGMGKKMLGGLGGGLLGGLMGKDGKSVKKAKSGSSMKKCKYGCK